MLNRRRALFGSLALALTAKLGDLYGHGKLTLLDDAEPEAPPEYVYLLGVTVEGLDFEFPDRKPVISFKWEGPINLTVKEQ